MRYLYGIVLLGLIGYLLTGVTQVRPGERALVRRFGRVVDKPAPGLRIGLPYGMERVDRVPVDLVRRLTIGYQPEAEQTDETTPPGQLLTGDHNLVNVQVVLDYSVQEEALEDYVVQSARADGVITRAGEAILAEWVSGHKVDEVLIRGKAELPAVLVAQTKARIEPFRLGVAIRRASVSYLFPPTAVKSAFDDVTRAQSAMRTQEYKAREEAAKQLRSAQAEKHRIEKMTAAYVNEQVVLAQAEADTFEKRLKQYQELRRDNPYVLAGIWWDQIGKLFTQMKEAGRLDLLDDHLGADGLDITISPPLPKKP
ncbi:MAG TPA: protease modulator HflK [Gemmataceae bacterium]|nr:protease modulator HflK [Gemmataceae bacterium]